MEQFLFKSETFFRLWGKRWGSRRASSLWARRRTMGNRSKWRVPEFPIASPRKLLFDIHTGSRKKGQRKIWALNGQQTNSGVFRGNLAQLWNEVMLKSGNKYRPAVKNGHSKKKKLKFRVAFLFHDCNKNSLLLWDFLSGFLAKLKWWTTLTYIITNCYNISALSLDLHIYPVWFQPFPMLNIKKDSWTKHLFFFLSLQQQIGLKKQIVIASRSLWSIRPAIIQIKILYCVSTFEGTWKVQFGKILLNLFPKFLSSHCLVASQPLASRSQPPMKLSKGQQSLKAIFLPHDCPAFCGLWC